MSIAIIGVLAAIAIPAVQSSRETARNASCKNNLRQVMLGTQSFHNAERSLPPLFNGTALKYPLAEWDQFHMHSWRVPLLRHMEYGNVREMIDPTKLATDPENLPAAQTVVPVFICPSGSDPHDNMGWGLKYDKIESPQPPPEEFRYRVVRSDYDAIIGIQNLPDPLPEDANPNSIDFIRFGVWGWPRFQKNENGGPIKSYRAGRFRDVADGLSNTIAVVERGGKPIEMLNGKPWVTDGNPNADYPGQVGWSASNYSFWAVNADGVGVNESNSRGIYSLHHGGANVAMADGSVRFLSDSIAFEELVNLFGRTDGR